jgi:pimeloyl-ACP methyl ester carboxylesterase
VPQTTLPDGRRLAYQVTGAPGGSPVVVLHGTPGSSRQLAGLHRPARDRGLARPHLVEGGGHMLLSHPDQIIESLAPRAA